MAKRGFWFAAERDRRAKIRSSAQARGVCGAATLPVVLLLIAGFHGDERGSRTNECSIGGGIVGSRKKGRGKGMSRVAKCLFAPPLLSLLVL